MKISHKGLELIKHFEGLRTTAYKCPAGVLTIGYGHTGRDVLPGMSINEKYADALLQGDVITSEQDVNRLVHVALTQSQYDALVSFVFNIGGYKFGKSTLLAKLNARDYEGAAKEFKRWNKAKHNGVMIELEGLKRRREAETQLFNEVNDGMDN